jgi:uncharacterized protein (TIGR04255 family)
MFTPNPIVMALAQVQFPTILAISGEAPVAFQELVRQTFPLFRERQGITIQFGQPLLVPASPLGTRVYDFAVADGSLTLSLAQDFLSVQTSQYKTWDVFRPQLELGIKALTAVYKPAFISRVGLRYQDLIVRSKLGLESVAWKDLLNPTIAGELENEDLASNVLERSSNVTLTLNNEDERLTLNHGLVISEKNEQCYLIDADFFSGKTVEPDHAIQSFNSLKRHSGRFFRWAISSVLAHKMAAKLLE